MEDLTIIDTQYESGTSLVKYLEEKAQLSFHQEAENNFRKTILLSSASFFEKEISDTVIEFAKSHTNNNLLIISIIKQKAVSRQYHQYFEWSCPNAKGANIFFSMFGDDFKKEMEQLVKEDEALDKSIKAFLEIGRERNKMVHQNFAEVVIEKTAFEIYELYKTASYFIRILKIKLIKQN